MPLSSRSLLPKPLVFALVLVASGCSHAITPNNPLFCASCQFLYSTTASGQILVFMNNGPNGLGAPISVPGPANSPGIVAGFISTSSVPVAAFLYVADPQNKTVDVFSLSSHDGTPSKLGLFSLSATPVSMGGSEAIFPFAGGFYVGNSAGTLDGFNISLDGLLTKIPGSPFPSGASPSHLLSFATNPTATSTASFLCAANFADPKGSLAVFLVDNSTGALTPIAASPFPTSANSGPSGLAVTNNFLFVALHNSNSIAAFSIRSDGSLSLVPGSPFPAGQGPSSLASSSQFLYTMNSLDNTVSAYAINSSNGSLSPIAGSPFPVPTSSGELLLLSGILYVPDPPSNSIAAFAADPNTGVLTPLNGSPFPAAGGPIALAVDQFPASDHR